MRKTWLLFTAIAALVLSVQTASAQKNSAAIGLRVSPDGAGFNMKAMMSRYLAFEGMLNVGGVMAYPGESFTAVALLEAHIPLPDPSWRLIFGGGLHAGIWDNGAWYSERQDAWVYNRAQPIVGMDAIGGAEYVFKKIPLGLSADIKPAINFTSGGPEFFEHNMFGLTARYYFK